jgi:hypothetical protein
MTLGKKHELPRHKETIKTRQQVVEDKDQGKTQ